MLKNKLDFKNKSNYIIALVLLLVAVLVSSCAKKEIDTSECDNVQSPEGKGQCYVKLAIEKNDPSACDKLQDQGGKDLCYVEVVKIKQDPSLCQKISHQSLRDNCNKFVAQIPS